MDRRFGFMVRSEGVRISCEFNGLFQQLGSKGSFRPPRVPFSFRCEAIQSKVGRREPEAATINLSLTTQRQPPSKQRESQMAMFRILLADGERNLKTDLKALNGDSARSAAEKWFDDARWRIVAIRRLSD